jgi:hypothetical protein
VIGAPDATQLHRVIARATGRKRAILFLPIVAAQVYFTLSVLVFAFGPWPWPVKNPVKLYVFLGLAQLSLAVGYWRGARAVRPRRVREWNVPRLVRFSLWTNVAWIVPKFVVRAGLEDAGIGAVWNQILFGLTDPAAAHAAMATSGGAGKLALIYALFTPLLFLGMPLAVAHWERLRSRDKVLFFVVAGSEALSWIATGTSKGVVDSVIVLLAAVAPAIVTRWRELRTSEKIKYASIIILGALLASGFFLHTQFARRGANVTTYDRHYKMWLDERHVLLEGRSLEFQAGIGYFLNYLNQGYYALALALDEPFEFTWGVGNSFFWAGALKSVSGIDVGNHTYAAKLEKYGIDRYVNWHTLYTWFASDLSFPGVIGLLAVVGYYFALAWRSAVQKQNPYGLAVFALLVMVVLYVPANNQVLAFTPTAFAFPVLFFRWRTTGG